MKVRADITVGEIVSSAAQVLVAAGTFALVFIAYRTRLTTRPIKASRTIGPTTKLKHRYSARKQLSRMSQG